MEDFKIVWVEKRKQFGVVMINETQYNVPIIINGITQYVPKYTLINVMLEDDSTIMCMDNEIEVIEEI